MKECVFCKIVAGEEPAEIVYRDQHAVGFLDNRPLFPGHVLLVPLQHCETLADLPRESVGPLFHAAQALEAAVEKALDSQGSFVAINNRVSQSVPHLHVHVVPRKKGDGLKGFFWPRRGYDSPAHLAETGAKIREALTARQ